MAQRLGKISWEEASRITKIAVEKLKRVHAALSSDPAPIDDGWEIVGDDTLLDDDEASSGLAEASTSPRPARYSSAMHSQKATETATHRADETETQPAQRRLSGNTSESGPYQAANASTAMSPFLGAAPRAPPPRRGPSRERRASKQPGRSSLGLSPQMECASKDLVDMMGGFEDVPLYSGLLEGSKGSYFLADKHR
ncbi:hypothetical protein MFIFM68171_08629 [Madurella fahalii]|uniref:Uncharacterized protein n=1 Tax=Madurella fahalii TaxID=1157608 RepID=A0ABQ0GL47_9PEZI